MASLNELLARVPKLEQAESELQVTTGDVFVLIVNICLALVLTSLYVSSSRFKTCPSWTKCNNRSAIESQARWLDWSRRSVISNSRSTRNAAWRDWRRKSKRVGWFRRPSGLMDFFSWNNDYAWTPIEMTDSSVTFTMKFQIWDVFDLDVQLDSIAPSVRSNPTARRGGKLWFFSKVFTSNVTVCIVRHFDRFRNAKRNATDFFSWKYIWILSDQTGCWQRFRPLIKRMGRSRDWQPGAIPVVRTMLRVNCSLLQQFVVTSLRRSCYLFFVMKLFLNNFELVDRQRGQIWRPKWEGIFWKYISALVF